jgi:hypothetical protein
MAGNEDPNVSAGEQSDNEKRYTAPYGGRHPIPTVKHYREIQGERDKLDGPSEDEPSDRKRDSVKRLFVGEKPGKGDENPQGWAAKGQNRNVAASTSQDQVTEQHDEDETDSDEEAAETPASEDKPADTSEATSNEGDLKAKRKAMKGRTPEKDKKSRQVTDPVTHLPVTVHDFTAKELNDAPANLSTYGSDSRTATGLKAQSKDSKELDAEQDELQAGYEGMHKLFPPPSFEGVRKKTEQAYIQAFNVSAIALIISVVTAISLAYWFVERRQSLTSVSRVVISLLIALALPSTVGILYVCHAWLSRIIEAIWDDETWKASWIQEQKQQRNLEVPESSMWLNSVIAAIWPLVNPDLFNSLVDTLEDVMQASLPKVVRMIAIEDFGQGKSAIRILGVRWLPSGAASETVTEDGKIKRKKANTDRDAPDQGSVDNDCDDDSQQDDKNSNEEEEVNTAEGLEAESGDFLNLEIAFSYRASSKGKSLKRKTENAHLYLVFYLPAGKFSEDLSNVSRN